LQFATNHLGHFSLTAHLMPLLRKNNGAPVLFVATAPDAMSGCYYGPDGWSERKGFPAPAKIPTAPQDESVAAGLWELAEKLIHVRFEEWERTCALSGCSVPAFDGLGLS
jgi:hypothetical protein